MMDKDEFRQVLEAFCEGQEFTLNPDGEHLEFLLDGVMKIQSETGLKYCPCRLRTGDPQKDLLLLCPCNFFVQDTWKNRGMCWCGLFVKRD